MLFLVYLYNTDPVMILQAIEGPTDVKHFGQSHITKQWQSQYFNIMYLVLKANVK